MKKFVGFITALILCFVIHEGAHFVGFKLFNVGVNDFRILWGQEIASVEFGETKYSFGWLPIGAWVEPSHSDFDAQEIADIALVNPERANMLEDVSRRAESLSPFREFLVLIAGPLSNFLTAFVVYFIWLRRNGIKDAHSVIGIAVEGQEKTIMSNHDALAHAWDWMFRSSWREFRMIFSFFGFPKVEKHLGLFGPRMQMTGSLLLPIGILSIALGVFNLLFPIPPLDGGKIWFSVVEMVGFEIAEATKTRISSIGFRVVLVMMFMGDIIGSAIRRLLKMVFGSNPQSK